MFEQLTERAPRPDGDRPGAPGIAVRDAALLLQHLLFLRLAHRRLGVARGVPSRPLLAPWYRLVGDGDRLLLEHGRSVVVLEGAAVRVLLPVLLPLLDGTRTLDELSSRLGAAVRPALEAALELLAANDLLVEGPDVRAALRPSVHAVAAGFGLTPAEAAERLGERTCRRRRVLAGRRARSPGSSMRPGSPRCAGSPGAAGRRSISPSSRRRETRSTHCPAGTCSRSERGSAGSPCGPFDGLIATVGPLVVPGESSCHECLLLRLAANVEYGPDLAEIEAAPVAAAADAALEALVGGARRAPRRALDRRARHDAAGRAARGRGAAGALADRAPRAPGAPLPRLLAGRAARASAAVARGGAGMIAALPPRLRRAVSPYVGIVRSVEECLHAPTEPPLFEAASEVGGGARPARRRRSTISPGSAGRVARARMRPRPRSERRSSGTRRPTSRPSGSSSRRPASSATRPSRPSGSRSSPSGSTRVRRSRTGASRADTGSPGCEGASLPAGRPGVPARRARLPRAGHRRRRGADRLRDEQRGRVRRDRRRDRRSRALRAARARRVHDRLGEPALAAAARAGPPRRRSRRSTASSSREPACATRRSTSPSSTGCRACSASCVRPRAPPGALGVGAGTAPTIEQAWWKALAEAFAASAAGAKLALLDPGRDLGPARRRGRLVRRSHPSTTPTTERAAAAGFLDASEHRTPVELDRAARGRRSPPAWIAALCARVEAAGSSAYAVDVTSPDVAELGLTVTKMIAPELCALDVSHAARFLGGRRLYEAAAALGLREEVARARATSTPTRIRSPDGRSCRPPSSPRSSTGADGVPLDDPAEAFHEASRLYPNVAPARLATLLELARERRAPADGRALEPNARSPARSRASAGAAACATRSTTLLAPPAVESRRGLAAGQARRARAPCSAPPTRRPTPRRVARRPVPSGGALYPLELYVVALAVERPRARDLPLRSVPAPARPARPGRVARGAGGPRRAGACSMPPRWCSSSPRCSGAPGSSTALRGYRFALLEAGHRRPERGARRDRARPAGAAGRRVLRPAARRARRAPTASTRRPSTRSCSGARRDARPERVGHGIAAATAFAIALLDRASRPAQPVGRGSAGRPAAALGAGRRSRPLPCS